MQSLYKPNLQTSVARGVCIAIFSFFVSVSTIMQAQSPPTPEDELQARCKQTGLDHNKGLDYVFNYLKKSGQQKTQKDILNLAEQATVEYMKTTSYSGNENQKRELEGLIHSEFQNISERGKIQGMQDISAEVSAKMTVGQKEIMTDVFAVANDMSMNLSASLQKLDFIEARAKAICDREELFLILSAISVGKHSMQYWHDNYEKWMTELAPAVALESETDETKVALASDTTDAPLAKKGKDKKGKKRWFRWKKVVGQDIAGAVGGAVYSGLMTPFSWAVTCGLGLAYSTGTAVMQLWEHYL